MSTIENLYDQYIKERGVNLSLEQFTLFATFFPTLLVILSDGTMDSGEDMHLKRLSNNLASAFVADGLGVRRIEELKGIFSLEFDYLIKNIEQWKELFLIALKNHLHHYPESKETVLDTLHLFAETSEDVDDAENDMIQYLIEKLDLIDNSSHV
ncbi:MAG: hypothetical protein NW226_09620 [Microscillaceae bacterium]|nr:hypothetical protein [Microscillaceae bacterium]